MLSLVRAGVVAGMLLLAPPLLQAAGLGKLNVLSSLGQPLQAEIDLVNVPKGEIGSLVARVASPDAFRDAKLDFNSALSSVTFVVERRANGQPYLRMATAQAVNEPFLDVLIELSWSSGKLLREYPVLLDPPAYAAAKAPVAVALPESGGAPASERKAKGKVAAPAKATPAMTARSEDIKPAAGAQPAGEPARQEPGADVGNEPGSQGRGAQPGVDQATPQSGADSKARNVAQPAPVTEAKESVQAKPPAEVRSAAASSAPDARAPARSEAPYVVKRGDTLYRIATKLRPEGVTIEQMLLALYQENKDAFSGQNMNRMRTGQVLKVPEASVAAAIDAGEAQRQVKIQASDWNGYRQKLAVAVRSRPARETPAEQSSSGKIAPAVEKPPAANAPAQDVLKLSRGDTPASGRAGRRGAKNGGSLQDRLNTLQEEAVARDNALREANERVALLEKNIRDLQQLVELKKSASPAAASAAAGLATPAGAALGAGGAKPPPANAQGSGGAAPAAQRQGFTKVAAAAPERSLTDEVMAKVNDNPLYVGIGFSLLVLALLLAILARRRREQDLVFVPHELGSNAAAAHPASAPKASVPVEPQTSSFLSDFDQLTPGTTALGGEIDPVAEADVYIAQGRDAQAEELLKAAAIKDPARREIALKLLEIYHARKSKAAFETVAKQLQGSIGARHASWNKVAEMGRSIDPGNALYAAAGAASIAVASSTPPASPEAYPGKSVSATENLFNIGPIAAAPASGTAGVAKAPLDSLDMDFDMDLGDKTHAPATSFKEPEKAPHAQAPTPGHDLDFDLALPFEKPAPERKNDSPVANKRDDPFLLDFDLDAKPVPTAHASGEPQGKGETAADAGSDKAHDPLDFKSRTVDLINANAGSSTAQPPLHSPAPVVQAIPDRPPVAASVPARPVIDLMGRLPRTGVLKAVPESRTTSPHAASLPELDLSPVNLDLARTTPGISRGGARNDGDWQKVSTKLDLARAYLEIGDKEGAHEILQEVVEEGDAEQKQEAKRLSAQV